LRHRYLYCLRECTDPYPIRSGALGLPLLPRRHSLCDGCLFVLVNKASPLTVTAARKSPALMHYRDIDCISHVFLAFDSDCTAILLLSKWPVSASYFAPTCVRESHPASNFAIALSSTMLLSFASSSRALHAVHESSLFPQPDCLRGNTSAAQGLIALRCSSRIRSFCHFLMVYFPSLMIKSISRPYSLICAAV
jgi:hypothetical protein